jgi:uncharacterized protein with FMN-binding domain
MTALAGPVRSRKPEEAAARRARARRVVAFAGMLTTIGALVGLRASMTPAATQALGSSGLAAEAGTNQPTHTSSSASKSSGAGNAPRPANRVVVGKAYDVSYGIVQVKVTLKGSRITDVAAVSLPQGGRSSDISRYAGPELRREALSKQGAHIDTVSGASYTSAGYAMSLQSALDKRGG